MQSQPYDVPVPLPPEGWPMMVTFADIADPTSVERVKPNDLATNFGPGVRLKAVTLEITQAGATAGTAEAVLPWLCDHITNYRRLSGESGSIGDNRLSNRLGPGNFLVGQCK